MPEDKFVIQKGGIKFLGGEKKEQRLTPEQNVQIITEAMKNIPKDKHEEFTYAMYAVENKGERDIHKIIEIAKQAVGVK